MPRIDQYAEADSKLDVLLAFQPVYAKNMDVQALELIIENADHALDSLDSILAISEIIVKSYSGLYQQGEVQTVPSFLKINAEILLDKSLTELPKKHYILEIDSHIEASDEMVERLRELNKRGYLLALSGYHSGAQGLEPLLDVVHILKLDISEFAPGELNAVLGKVRSRNLDLLADNLQSPEQFRLCVDAGFAYFRGDFLAKPKAVERKLPGHNKLLLLQILSELESPNTSNDRLERIIIQDAQLTYKFIKVVNSATYGISREIETLSHALSILGTKQIRRWVSLFLLEGHDDRPQDLIRTMLIRGRMCEVLAELSEQENTISYFIVGLLSQLDVLTETTMLDLMAQVPLNQEIKDALLSGTGNMGTVLQEVSHYEQGNFDQLSSLPDRSFYEVAYRHSTAWARQLQISTHP